MLLLFINLLKAKLVVLGAANIPLIATLLVLGTVGFTVTGTIQVNGDDDDRRVVNLVVKPLETKTCVDALIAQTETLLELDALAADTNRQLRHARDGARERADDQGKLIDDAMLRVALDTAAAKIPPALATARMQVLAAADLTKCRDGDPNTTVDVNVEALRATYDAILASFGQTLGAIVTDAQHAFDQLVTNAQVKQTKHEGGDDDEDEADDD